MNIYVFVKRVPDTESKIRVDHGSNTIITEGLNHILSPFDEYAVEEALRIKESQGGKVTVLSVGPDEAAIILKKCLAMGADEAVLVKDDQPETFDGFRTAKIIAGAMSSKFSDYDLLLFGKQSFGTDNGQVQTMVAEMLGLPQVNTVTKLEIDGTQGLAYREIEGATEKVPFSLPAVISAQKGLNNPRYETLKGIMMAKRKQIPVLTMEEIGLGDAALLSKTKVIKLEYPPPREAGTVIKDEPAVAAKKMVEYLRQVAKVL